MKRMCKMLACLIAVIMLLNVTPIAVFGSLDAQSSDSYVTDGLVAWYDGVNHGTSDTVWEDLKGDNDFTVVSDGTSGFNGNGYYLKDAWCQLPDAVTETLKGDSFTMEFYMGEVVNNTVYHTLIGTPLDDSHCFSEALTAMPCT